MAQKEIYSLVFSSKITPQRTKPIEYNRRIQRGYNLMLVLNCTCKQTQEQG